MKNHANNSTFSHLTFAVKTFFFLCLLHFSSGLFSQVRTTVLNGTSLTDFIPLHSDAPIDPIYLPSVDVEAALLEDSIKGIQAPRFGVKVPMDATKTDGVVEEKGAYLVWRIAFKSIGAVSLNFQFADLFLPTGSLLYVYNKQGSMCIGPVENENVIEGEYSTDVLKGNEAIIEVIMPKETLKAFAITVAGVVHGFQDIEISTRSYGDSAPCNNDVACLGGGGNQGDAVGMIISGNTRICSGALINNACQNLRPFFLTADHCVEGQNPQNWVIRFNYDSPTCGGSEPTEWVTYNGTNLRARHSSSDFALVELVYPVIGQSTLAMAGWDRADANTTSGFGIHHPKGDVKKISVDFDPSVIEGYGTTGDTHLKVIWDDGTTEKGSSGSPLFDQSSRVVGQLHGGDTVVCSGNKTSWYGRFFKSWTGNNSSSTRLSDWLGGNGNPTTTNTVRTPSISGNSPICTVNKTFVLDDLVPGYGVTWTVAPTLLFATTGGASTSGTTTSAILRALNSNSSGAAVLTFTLIGGACDDTIIVSRRIWVGRPNFAIVGNFWYCPGNYGYVSMQYNGQLVSTQEQGITNLTWTFQGPLSSFNSQNTSASFIAGPGLGSGVITAIATNACGTTTVNFPFVVQACFGGGGSEKSKLVVSPNPSQGIVTVEVKDNIHVLDAMAQSRFQLFDKFGNVITYKEVTGLTWELDVSELVPGIYFVEMKHNGINLKEKILVTH